MKPKIGVMGGASGQHSDELLEKAKAVGRAIAEKGCIMVYGATIGLPLAAAQGAREKNGFVLGISPAANKKEHLERYKYPTDACNTIVFTGFGFPGRNVVLVRSCDAIIIIGGRAGTMTEFAVAYVEGRPIGVLEGSGGFAGRALDIEKEVFKGEKDTPIVSDAVPEKLVEKLLSGLGREK